MSGYVWACRSIAFAGAIWVATGTATAQEKAGQLQGTAFFAGKTPVDPPPEEKKNTHVYMTVTGATALRMYRAMPGPEEANNCTENGKIKRAGSLECALAANGRTASCDFSVDMVRGALDDGRPC